MEDVLYLKMEKLHIKLFIKKEKNVKFFSKLTNLQEVIKSY